MEYKLLGRTGLKVSQLCFGTMSFGGEADEAGAIAMYAACRERGINVFDCADAYSKGKAEEILGRLMAHERDDLIVTTKCFNPTGPDINASGANRRHILRAVEASLKRLGTVSVRLAAPPRSRYLQPKENHRRCRGYGDNSRPRVPAHTHRNHINGLFHSNFDGRPERDLRR
jgi:diketogulonate reductase-like aldo/keto reductase